MALKSSASFQSAGKRFQVHAQGGTVWLHAEPTCGASRRKQARRQRRPPRQATNIPNAVKVSVSDTGPGIRPEFHLEIFDDSSACPAASRPKAWASDSPSPRLLQGMGGKIWVESEPGAGCKFSFIIP